MTKLEKKSWDIFNLIRKIQEHAHEESSLGYFKGLEKYNIQYELADGSKRTLSYIHFNAFRTQFLPDGKLYWVDLAKGEYKRISTALLRVLNKQTFNRLHS